MKQLIIVRHGDYGNGGQLTNLGRSQIGQMVEKLRPFVDGASVFVLSSTATRARESAAIIADAFGAGFEEHQVLWLDSDHPEDFPSALNLISSSQDKADVLIVVTHFEYANDLAGFFGSEELGAHNLPRSNFTEMGEAWVLNCQQKTLTHVR